VKKKLLAAAVVSAFAAPVALAQPANVVIYGNFAAEVTSAQSSDATNAPGSALPSRMRIGQPGGSHIGFRGTENLGGGLSVVWQVESNIGGWDGTGVANTFGSRDSFLGLRGGFGTVTLGHQTTPYATLLNGTVAGGGMFGATGLSGQTNIMSNGNLAGGSPTVGTGATTYQSSFNRRQESSIQYVSPSFSGLTARFLMSANEGKTNGAGTMAGGFTSAGGTNSATPAGASPYIWSGSLNYASGPFSVGFAYEKHNDLRALGTTTLDNNGWLLAGRWTSGPFMVAAAYERLTYEVLNGGSVQDLNRSAFGLQGQYSTGPHRLRAQYSRAQGGSNISGATTAPTANVNCVAYICAGNAAIAGQTGSAANQWSLGYGYALSKRTELYAFYSQLNNSAVGNYNTTGGQAGIRAGNGSDIKGFGAGVRHSF
jgi:predicted porin